MRAGAAAPQRRPVTTALLDEIRRRHQQRHGAPIDYRDGGLLEKIATLFSVTAQSRQETQQNARGVLDHIAGLRATRREALLDDIAERLPGVPIAITGIHNYAVFPPFVANLLEGRDLFSRQPLARLARIRPDVYGTRPARPHSSPPAGVATRAPSLHLEPLPRRRHRWLDIGAGVKADGPPGLGLVRECLSRLLPARRFEYLATDVFVPPLAFTGARIVGTGSKHRGFDATGRLVLRGVTVCNARFPENDVESAAFSLGRFDVISMAFVLPSLGRRDERASLAPISPDIASVGRDGEATEGSPAFWLTPSLRALLVRVLGSLEMQGVLFLQLLEGAGWRGCEPRIRYRNFSFYLVLQRVGRDRYHLHEQVVPFLLGGRPFSLSTLLLHPPGDGDTFQNVGIPARFPHLDGTGLRRTERWLRSADDLVFRTQRVNRSQAAAGLRAVQALNAGEDLGAVLAAYLADVPDRDLHKGRLLARIGRLESARDPARSPAAR